MPTSSDIVSKGHDESKDQSYVLWGLEQKNLARTRFPVGGYRKTEIRELAAKSGFERLAQTYREFVDCYQPVLAQLRDGASESGDENAFLMRMLLIHDYRRLLLRDPGLPDVLLASDWPWQRARLLCRELYRRLLAPSERHLDAHLQLADGHAPLASPRLLQRFQDADPLRGAG